jgi:hypothetical protein
MKIMNRQYNAAGCGTIVRLAESAFPILSVPGFWEAFKQRRADQGDHRVWANLDPAESHCLTEQSNWSYTIVPWED